MRNKTATENGRQIDRAQQGSRLATLANITREALPLTPYATLSLARLGASTLRCLSALPDWRSVGRILAQCAQATGMADVSTLTGAFSVTPGARWGMRQLERAGVAIPEPRDEDPRPDADRDRMLAFLARVSANARDGHETDGQWAARIAAEARQLHLEIAP